jgi:hypothetical protein
MKFCAEIDIGVNKFMVSATFYGPWGPKVQEGQRRFRV